MTGHQLFSLRRIFDNSDLDFAALFIIINVRSKHFSPEMAEVPSMAVYSHMASKSDQEMNV